MEPILTLDALPERPLVSLFGATYGLLTPDERGMLENFQIARYHRLAMEAAEGELDEEKVAKAADNLKAVCYTMLPDAPHDVIDRLTDGQRLRILATYNELFSGPATAPNGPQPAATSSRRGSNGSTAARTRRAG